MTTEELLAELDAAEPPAVPTGFEEVDRWTGGLGASQVWLVVGAPGEGRTMLTLQLAARLAAHELPTTLHTPRHSASDVARRLVSQLGPVPLNGRGSADRAALGRSRLRALPLTVVDSGSRRMPGRESCSRKTPVALVVDDGDLLGVRPQDCRRIANEGHHVLVSLPRHLVVTDRPRGRDLDPEWARAADVVLEVRHRGLVDAFDSDNPRDGEADFSVLHNHRGPCLVIKACFQGHYSRFVEAPR